MDEKHAKQIAELLNEQNKLVVHYDAQKVLQSAENYLYEVTESGDVAACLELKRVQWYQFEVDHLTVHGDFLRQGYGQKLLDQARKESHDRKRPTASMHDSTGQCRERRAFCQMRLQSGGGVFLSPQR